MSFKGVIEARCPAGCEPFETEIWSMIHGGNSPELREAAAAKECNLLLCPTCGVPFFAQEPYVYFEPAADILAFVFPESYRAEEERWRKKMQEDYAALKQAMHGQLPIDLEPVLFFGPDGLAELLEAETYRAEEREVMECWAKELGLSIYKVRPALARKQGIPESLPYVPPPSGSVTRANVILGLERLLAANDRLTAYQKCLETLRGESAVGAGLPPARS
jgi:hypothetical protein